MEIVAIIVGPIAAVLITLWHQRRERDYQRRFDTFQTLVVFRRHGLQREFVNALNLVPVLFGQDKEVMSKHRKLMECFNDVNWQAQDQEILSRILDRTETSVAELIRAIGKTVRVNVDDIDVLKGAYAPKGWSTVEQTTDRARLAVLDILEGRKMLPVFVVPPSDDSQDHNRQCD